MLQLLTVASSSVSVEPTLAAEEGDDVSDVGKLHSDIDVPVTKVGKEGKIAALEVFDQGSFELSVLRHCRGVPM